MPNFLAETLADAYRPFFLANTVLAALPTIAPQLADPFTPNGSNVPAPGVLDISSGNRSGGINYGKFLFYGTGTAAQTFEAKLIGWTWANTAIAGVGSGIWLPTTLADLTCTLGSTAGAGTTGLLTTSQLMVGTIAVISSLIEANYDLIPADNGIQMIRLDLSGFQRIQMCVGPSGGATNGNGLLSGF